MTHSHFRRYNYGEMVQILKKEFIWKRHCLFRIWLSASQKPLNKMIGVICCVFRESHLLPRTQLSHKKYTIPIYGAILQPSSVQILPVVRRLLGESSCEVLEIRYIPSTTTNKRNTYQRCHCSRLRVYLKKCWVKVLYTCVFL